MLIMKRTVLRKKRGKAYYQSNIKSKTKKKRKLKSQTVIKR